MKVVLTVRGQPIYEDEHDGSYFFNAGMTIDADGGRHTYAPPGSGLRGLDYLANAGEPGNWYGLVCSSLGVPIVAASGYYVSATTYQRREFNVRDPQRYLDSETEVFGVVPGPFRRIVRGIVLGCRGYALNTLNGQASEFVVGDIGPATHLGEGSIALANRLGIHSDPRSGGIEKAVIQWRVWPGQPAKGYELQPA